MSFADLTAFAGRHPILGTLFVVLTVAVIASQRRPPSVHSLRSSSVKPDCASSRG